MAPVESCLTCAAICMKAKELHIEVLSVVTSTLWTTKTTKILFFCNISKKLNFKDKLIIEYCPNKIPITLHKDSMSFSEQVNSIWLLS